MTTPALVRAGVVLGGAALSAGLVAAPTLASTPESSTLTAPQKTGTAITAWSGSLASPGLIVLAPTDSHALSISIPGKKPEKYFKKRAATVSIEMSWDGEVDDLDLYVYDADGNEVASSISGPGVEQVTIPVTGAVDYTVEVEGFISSPGIAYNASATLTVTKAAPAG